VEGRELFIWFIMKLLLPLLLLLLGLVSLKELDEPKNEAVPPLPRVDG